MSTNDKKPFGREPEDRMAIVAEIIALLRRHYGDFPEMGGDAVAAALVTLVGVRDARFLLGSN